MRQAKKSNDNHDNAGRFSSGGGGGFNNSRGEKGHSTAERRAAFKEGEHHAVSGGKKEGNPHEKGSDLHSQWNLGHRSGSESKISKRSFIEVAKSIYANEMDGGAKTFAELISQRLEQQQRWEADEELRPLFCALQECITSIAADASVDTQAKIALIAQSVWDFMNSVAEMVPEVEQELTMALTTAGKAGNPSDMEIDMTDLEKARADLAEALKNLATATAEVTTLKADLEVAKAATKVAQTDEVIKVGTIEVRKSVVGDTTFAVMKAQQEEIELHKFTTQANADIPNLPGEAADKAKVLRVISTLEAPVAKTLTEMLKGGNAAMAKAVKELGAGGGGNQDDPDVQLDQMAAKHGKDNNVSKAAAYDAVLRTPEGQALYNASEVRKRAA